MSKKSFFFIVFEGAEGTGKSFQINNLFNSLKKKKFKVEKTREPGGSKTAEKIRNLIFSSSNKFDKLTDFFLMLASRNEHLIKRILVAKKNKKILICDRFIDSTFAYQVVGNKINNKINLLNNNYILNNLKPNLTIILKSNIKAINQRLKKRKNKNNFDKLKNTFHMKMQNTFVKLAKRKKNYFIFDSSANDNNLEKKILSLVLSKLKRI
jgi:dTMP kinase